MFIAVVYVGVVVVVVVVVAVAVVVLVDVVVVVVVAVVDADVAVDVADDVVLSGVVVFLWCRLRLSSALIYRFGYHLLLSWGLPWLQDVSFY